MVGKSVLRIALATCALAAALLAPLPSAGSLAQEGEPMVTPIAFQSFERGFMLWREDNDRITVAFDTILTKSGAPCQEIYRDTYQGQVYEIPSAPSGLTVPQLGFGWLYANDPQLAVRLGYATADEVSRVAEIRMRTTATGEQVSELLLSEPIGSLPNPLTIAQTDEPGLTYCFARGNENRSALNAWVAVQSFEYGYMLWRQDRPDRIDVVHHDTDFAPELSCLDIFADTWRPGETLVYGDAAVPGRRLPERGFGKVWVDNGYVRQSLGYPIEAESGGFAEVTFERFEHPRRGDLLVRRTVFGLPGGEEFRERATISGGGGREQENVPNQGCSRILIPHAPR